jgi:AcrR family transcriptional regulator
MTISKINTWIKAGYKLLGTEGMDGIKVERLARILDLNKSGFYHYFGTMEFYEDPATISRWVSNKYRIGGK